MGLTTDRTKWFKERKWGIFVHYLDFLQNGENIANNSKYQKTSWDECVKDFDVELFAKQMYDIGAGYVFFTLCQADKYLCAPNETFDEISGYKPGEACSVRDLPMELADALDKYGIGLMLYFTGDGPRCDRQACKAFGALDENKLDVDYDFVSKWAAVMKEYSLRYGKKVHGWWIDGCFDYIGYNDELLKLYRDAALAGNEDAVIAFNNGIVRMDFSEPELAEIAAGANRYTEKLDLVDKAARKGNLTARRALIASDTPPKYRYSKYEDYTAGESSYFKEIPTDGLVDGCRWHALSFLGLGINMPLWSVRSGWAMPGSAYSGDELREYINNVNSRGGVVSIDVFVRRDGSMDKAQLEVLKKINGE